MLKSEQSIAKSKSESSIRHQVRKLRAKVKALIPNEVCLHFEKRNQRIQKINMLRSNQANKQLDNCKQHNLWKASVENYQPYHSSNGNQEKSYKKNCHYQFDRLWPDQIEQVNEDKNYYLGQKNVEAYNKYLKHFKFSIYSAQAQPQIKHEKQQIKHSSNQRSSIKMNSTLWEKRMTYNSFEKPTKIKKNSFIKDHVFDKKFTTTYSNTRISDENNLIKQRNTVGGFHKQGSNSNHFLSANQLLGQTTMSKIKNVEKKSQYKKSSEEIKQFIEQQDRQKRMYQKLKLEMEITKAESNQRETKYKKYFKLKQMANEQKQKLQKAKRKKNLLAKKGEVVKLDEKLRHIIILRNKMQENRSNSCIFQYEINHT